MKKSLIKLAVLLVVVSMITMACGSDSKDSDKKETKKSSDSSSKKISGSKDSDDDVSDLNYAPITESKYDSQVEQVISLSKQNCANVETAYVALKNAGSENDGFDDILDLKSALFDYAYDISEYYYTFEWPDEYENLDKTTPSFYDEKIEPLINKADSTSELLDEVVGSSIYDAQSAEQLNDLHNSVKEYVLLINELGFGPCSF